MEGTIRLILLIIDLLFLFRDDNYFMTLRLKGFCRFIDAPFYAANAGEKGICKKNDFQFSGNRDSVFGRYLTREKNS